MNGKILVLIILIVLFLPLIILCSCNNFIEYQNENFNDIKKDNKKPYLWLYWDGNMPEYIKLCIETIYKHCSKSFEIVFLNKDVILKYLPELKDKKYNFDHLIIPHKVDIYRIMLLHKYGGLYIDADVIVQKDLKDITDKLKDHDFVAFGCTGNKCTEYYGKPSNWVLASKKGTQLMKNILKRQLEIVNNKKLEYHEIGKEVIWQELEKLIKKGYKYYHFDPYITDGSRDINGYWVDSRRVFSDENIKYKNENLLFNVFYNSGINDEIKKMSRDDLLKKDWNFSRFIKKSLYKK